LVSTQGKTQSQTASKTINPRSPLAERAGTGAPPLQKGGTRTYSKSSFLRGI